MKLFACGSLLALTLVAPAAVQTSSHSFGPSSIPFGGTAVLDKFDTNGGLHELTRVEFFYTASMQAHVVAHSSASEQVITVGVSGSTTANDGALFNFGGGIFAHASSPLLITGGSWDFGVITGQYNGYRDLESTFWNLYTGDGETFEIEFDGVGLFGIVGSGSAELDIVDFEADGLLEVVYTYTVVPSPGALALLGLTALIGIVPVRRRD